LHDYQTMKLLELYNFRMLRLENVIDQLRKSCVADMTYNLNDLMYDR